MKNKTTQHLLAVLGVIALVAVAFHFKWGQAVYEPALPRNAPAKHGGGFAQSVLGASAKVEKAIKTLTATDSCKQNQVVVHSIDLLPGMARRLARGKTAILLFDETIAPCFRQKEVYDLFLIHKDPGSGKIFARFNRGRATLNSIQEAELGKIPKKLLNKLMKLDRREFMQIRSSSGGGQSEGATKIIILSFVKSRFSLDPNSSETPSAHPLVENVSNDAAKAALKPTTLVLDTRPQKIFDAGALPGATHIPLDAHGAVARQVWGPNAFYKLAHPDLSLLPTDKNKTILVYGSGLTDASSYNLATYLAINGYQHVKWYREGYGGATGKDFATPMTLSGVHVISIDELEGRVGDYQVLDSRTGKQYLFSHPKGALHVPFRQLVDPQLQPLNRPLDPAPAALLALKEGFIGSNISKVPQGSLLVIGRDEYDWRAFKAASALAKSGFKNVYWLRNGWNAWKYAHWIRPKLFEIESGGQADAGSLPGDAASQARLTQTIAERQKNRQKKHKHRGKRSGGGKSKHSSRVSK